MLWLSHAFEPKIIVNVACSRRSSFDITPNRSVVRPQRSSRVCYLGDCTSALCSHSALTSQKSGSGNLSGSLPKIATHPIDPHRSDDVFKGNGGFLITNQPTDLAQRQASRGAGAPYKFNGALGIIERGRLESSLPGLHRECFLHRSSGVDRKDAMQVIGGVVPF